MQIKPQICVFHDSINSIQCSYNVYNVTRAKKYYGCAFSGVEKINI